MYIVERIQIDTPFVHSHILIYVMKGAPMKGKAFASAKSLIGIKSICLMYSFNLLRNHVIINWLLGQGLIFVASTMITRS